MEEISIFTDGGALGNPGPAAVGVVVKKLKIKKEAIARFGKRIGIATNNVAEYQAVIAGLEWLKENCPAAQLSDCQIEFFLDSKLVVNQLNGLYKIKDAKLRDLAIKIRQLEQGLGGNIFYHLIPREQNSAADLEVKKALGLRI
jgi:ribonuclease HI